MLRRLKLSESGFTGIEVLIVLTIVVIVALLVANNIQESVARGRDIERRSDVNAIQDALEEYWHSQEHYPTDLTAIGLSGEALTDPNGNFILIAPPAESDNKPASSYNSAEQPEQEYTYAPYQCGGGEAEPAASGEADSELVGQEVEGLGTIKSVTVEGIQVCQKYVIYSWLEKAELSDVPYQRNNLHNL